MNKVNESDYLGKVFSRLTVLSIPPLPGNGVQRKVMCQCSCGEIVHVPFIRLRNGRSKSCGCKRREFLNSRKKHEKSKEYTILRARYSAMINRCQNPNNKFFHNYGGRGITVCDEWIKSPIAFVNWCLDNGFKESLQIDRRDNDKGYSPDNCRFVTRVVNMANRRVTTTSCLTGLMTINNFTKPFQQWCRVFGISQPCALARLKRGLNAYETFMKPPGEYWPQIRKSVGHKDLNG